jgi:NAD(P)-dependent dehydrogenase (short-subunit alcohol dehydrogenase family)
MNVVITGASAGIGYQTCMRLALEGHGVVAISRRQENLEKLKTETLAQNQYARLYTVAGDLSQEHFLDEAAKEISACLGSVDVLVNNAGLLVNKPFSALTASDWKDVYTTNVFAAVGLIRVLLPLFSGPGRKHILNISSMGGFQGSSKFPGLSAYSSSKAALVGITECLAEEFKDKNISVNCLCLGSVKTEMFAAAFPSFTASATSEEAARFIATFAVEGSALFNGKIIPVSSTTP